MLNEALKQEYRGELRLLPHGQKGKRAEEIANELGISKSQLYREIDITAGQKKCTREPEIDTEYINMIAAEKAAAGKMGVSKRFLTTEDAIDLLEQSGKLPKGLISVSTADRRMRELGFNKKRTYERHEDDYVNQVHHVDFSRAEYFDLGIGKDDEEVVRIDGRRGKWDYKNKEKAERKRLWVMGYIDSFSRVYLVRYFSATGETKTMGTEALEFAWQRNDDTHPLMYPPEVLKFDQGSFGKYLLHHKTFQRDTGVRIELAASKNNRYKDEQSQAKVERPFRTLWQRFELKTARILEAKGVKEISLDELNSLVYEYCVELLEKKHPLRTQSRGEVYRTGLRMRPQITIETSLWDILYNEETRKVGADKLLSFKGEFYKAPDKFAYQRIYVFTTNDGRLRGQDLDRHESFDLVPFDANNTEAVKQRPDTYMDKVAARDSELVGSRMKLVGGASGALQPHSLPPEEIEHEIDSPFSSTKVSKPITDWELAKMEICKVFDCTWSGFTDSTKTIFERLFEAEQLDKKAIHDLFNEVG